VRRVLEQDITRDGARQADVLGCDADETRAEIEKPAEQLLLLGGSLKVVAGAGFEPTTFGL
jgi:hypothetical protein